MLIDQPSQHLGRAITAVAEEPVRAKIKPFERAFNQALVSQYLRLPHSRGCLNIDDDRILDVDQIVRRVGERGLAAMGPRPTSRWVGGRHELRRNTVAAQNAASSTTARYSPIALPVASGGSPLSPSIPFCRLASALIRLTSTANPSPPTSRSSMQQRKTLSNTRRNRPLCRSDHGCSWKRSSDLARHRPDRAGRSTGRLNYDGPHRTDAAPI